MQVPVFISSTSIFTEQPVNKVLNWAAIALSVVGTLAIALEDFFQFGARARARHMCVAKLDRNFWSFHALSGPWDMYNQHSGEAYKKLTIKIEDAVREAEVQNIATFAGAASLPMLRQRLHLFTYSTTHGYALRAGKLSIASIL